jgi:DNA primase
VVGRDSVATTEKIRQASDILDVVASYLTLKRAGKDHKALCPFHTEKTPSFHVVPDKQIFKCFGCGAGGDVFKFIQMKEGVGFAEAREILAVRAGISLEDVSASFTESSAPTRADLVRVNRWACRWFQAQLRLPESAGVRSYIAERGISEESVEHFALGYAPESWDSLCKAAEAARIPTELLLAAGLTKKRDDGSTYDGFRHRLIFPIMDVLARVIGFGGRTLGDDPAKYLNSPQSPLFDKRRCLYGLRTAREAFAEPKEAIIVEGYLDCIAAQQAGFQNTVATLGTALTEEHCQMLRRYVDSAVLVFDSDTAGRQAADRSLGLFFAEGLDVRVAYVPEGYDPADLLATPRGKQAFEAVLTSARDALELKWSQVRDKFGTAGTGPERRRAIEAFLTLLTTSTRFGHGDPIQRGLILNQVGKLLGLSGEEVQQQLRAIARKAAPVRSAPVAPSVDQARRTPHAATAAMCDVLAVLINDPGYYPAIADEFDVELLDDEQLRRIAQVVVEAAAKNENLGLPQLMSRFESQDAARRIMELQSAGERHGNFAATIEGARACLQAVRQQRRVEAMIAGLKDDASHQDDPRQTRQPDDTQTTDAHEENRAQRLAICDVVRNTKHFAAGKHMPAQ